MPQIISIAYQPRDREYDDPLSDFIRVPVEAAELVAEHGIAGDQKAGHNKTRQINLLSAEWLAARAADGYRAGPGQFGEQIIIEGLAIESLPPGTLLGIGPQAIIAITKGRTGCERLQAVQPQPTTGLGPIGALARVVMGGPIGVGDAVAVLERESERAA